MTQETIDTILKVAIPIRVERPVIEAARYARDTAAQKKWRQMEDAVIEFIGDEQVLVIGKTKAYVFVSAVPDNEMQLAES